MVPLIGRRPFQHSRTFSRQSARMQVVPPIRRAEMWLESKTWLQDPAGSIFPIAIASKPTPVAPSYSYTSNTELMLERKDQMRKRGLPRLFCHSGYLEGLQPGKRPVRTPVSQQMAIQVLPAYGQIRLPP